MATLAAPLVAVDTTDEALVAAVQAGNDQAFEQLYERYRGRIVAYVYGRVGDHRAEDITQEVFVSALRWMRETKRPIAFKPWIYQIARNACIDAHRRSRHHDSLEDHLALASTSPTPDAAVDTRMALESLQGAFGGLSEHHHNALVMRELEGRSYHEIGERLGMSKSSVESTLFRARRRLREEWEKVAAVLPWPAFLRNHWLWSHAEPMSGWAKAATLAATVALAGTGTEVVTSQGDSRAPETAIRDYSAAPSTAAAQRQQSIPIDKPVIPTRSSNTSTGTTTASTRTFTSTVQATSSAPRASTPSVPSTTSAKTVDAPVPAGSHEIDRTSTATPSITTEADRPSTPKPSVPKPAVPEPVDTAVPIVEDEERNGRLLARIIAGRRAEQEAPVAEPVPEVTVPEPPVETTVTETAPQRPVLNAVKKALTQDRPVTDTTTDTTGAVTAP